MAFRLHEALGTQNERYFVAATPPAHSLACLRIDDPVTAAAARLATGVGGLAPHRTGFAPAGRQTEFHDVIASSLPSDQPCLVAPGTTASMQRDIMAGRPSELEAQTGSIVRLGRDNGVPTPVNTFIYDCLLPRERIARRRSAPIGRFA